MAISIISIDGAEQEFHALIQRIAESHTLYQKIEVWRKNNTLNAFGDAEDTKYTVENPIYEKCVLSCKQENRKRRQEWMKMRGKKYIHAEDEKEIPKVELSDIDYCGWLYLLDEKYHENPLTPTIETNAPLLLDEKKQTISRVDYMIKKWEDQPWNNIKLL